MSSKNKTMALAQTVYINFKGGIISPGYLKEVLQLAADARIETVYFGLRQQLIIDVPASYFNTFDKACRQKQINFEMKRNALPNIVSSYAAAGIFTGDTWLREGAFKDVFNLFDYTPKLKLNICDSTQQLVPFFTGHINWISSPSAHFWYLYIRLPKTLTAFYWRELIYTNDIASVSKQVEQLIIGGITGENNMYLKVKKTIQYTAKPIDKALQLQAFSLPYYEGLNKENNTWWLGIYRREEAFAVSFLNDVCDVCLQSKIGELYTTPWKSLIIKGIESNHSQLWNKVLGKNRINVRHAANELNWQVEDEEGLILKRLIIRHFDKEDVRTQGLCFAVQTKQYSSLFGSVIIRKQQVKNPHRLRSLDRYSILYKEGFNPNASKLIPFRENVEKDYLGTYLISLCKFYYEQENSILDFVQPTVTNIVSEEKAIKSVYQCKHCFTVYDEAAGDEEQKVAAGTHFCQLPAHYQCPTCEADKEAFIAVDQRELQAVL
jgi:rubredoxin